MNDNLNNLEASFDNVFHAIVQELGLRDWTYPEVWELVRRYGHLSDELQRMMRHPLYQTQASLLDAKKLAQIQQLRDAILLLRKESNASES